MSMISMKVSPVRYKNLNWQVKFNVDKVLYIGNINHHTNYTINGSELSKVCYGKDLGITDSKDLNPFNIVQTLRQLTN